MDAVSKSKKKLQVSIDRELSDEAQTVLDDIGLSPATAITVFYKQLVAQGGLPFELKQSPDQKALLDLQRAAATRPVNDLSNPQKLTEWFDDESQDY